MNKPIHYDFSKSNRLYDRCKFTICHLNAKYNENTQKWSVELPLFFTDNGPDFREIRINHFIYFRPNGTSDIGTTFHSDDLFDGAFSQGEMDYFIGVSGNSIGGVYRLSSRKRTLEFWFKDYYNMDQHYGDEEQYTDSNGEIKYGKVRFFIQAELFY